MIYYIFNLKIQNNIENIQTIYMLFLGENNKILVRSSPIERLVICGKATTSQYVECQNSELNEITLVRCKNSPWIRIILIDQFGRRAWSNPIWL